VFNAVDLPNKKLGLIFCLNRPTALYYIGEPVFDKKGLESKENYMQQINPAAEYLAMQPKFSKDFS
jgi:hypothetical protein